MTSRTQEVIRPGSNLDRTLAQRMAALTKADEVRSYRARLKRDIKAGRTSIYDILLDPPEMIETMKLIDLLMAMPKYGRVKSHTILQICTISSSKQIGTMTLRQRVVIVSLLRG